MSSGKIIYVDDKPCPVVAAQPDDEGAVWTTHIWHQDLSEGYYAPHAVPPLGDPARYGVTRQTTSSYDDLPTGEWSVEGCRYIRA